VVAKGLWWDGFANPARQNQAGALAPGSLQLTKHLTGMNLQESSLAECRQAR